MSLEGREITLPPSGAAGPTPCYVNLPAGAKRGVVVIHELLGDQPEIRRAVDRLARAGYAAIMPDLFCDGLKPACIVRTVREIDRGAGLSFDRARAAREWLQREAKLEPANVAILGFCMGGGFALVAGGGYGAVSANYGVVPDELPSDIGPIIACYGGRDVAFRGQAQKLREVAEKAGKSAEVHVFPTAGHSLLTDGNRAASVLSYPVLRIRYDAEVAEDAWGKILAFFDRQLG